MVIAPDCHPGSQGLDFHPGKKEHPPPTPSMRKMTNNEIFIL